MSTARKGRAFEHEIRKLFKDAKFSVMRGAGSKGELFGNKVDLIATKVTAENEYKAMLIIVGIQCKAYKRRTKND